MASKTKNIFKKLEKSEPIFSDNPIWIYIIFRLMPGIPYLIKNFSVIFFKLNLRNFLLQFLFQIRPKYLFYLFFKNSQTHLIIF